MANSEIRLYAAGYRYKTNAQHAHLLIYIMQGELLLSSPGQWVRLGVGYVGVFPKGSSFYLECSKDFRGLYLFLEETQPDLLQTKAYGLEGDTAIKVVAELLRMELSKEELSAKVIQALRDSFFELTTRISQMAPKPIAVKKEKSDVVQKAILKMQNNLYSKLNVESLLKSLGISYRQISRCFTKAKGESPKQFFIKLKMNEVCRLLKETSFSVTTIAHELGFASSQHLSSQFKLIYGITPKKWQQNVS